MTMLQFVYLLYCNRFTIKLLPVEFTVNFIPCYPSISFMHLHATSPNDIKGLLVPGVSKDTMLARQQMSQNLPLSLGGI